MKKKIILLIIILFIILIAISLLINEKNQISIFQANSSSLNLPFINPEKNCNELKDDLCQKINEKQNKDYCESDSDCIYITGLGEYPDDCAEVLICKETYVLANKETKQEFQHDVFFKKCCGDSSSSVSLPEQEKIKCINNKCIIESYKVYNQSEQTKTQSKTTSCGNNICDENEYPGYPYIRGIEAQEIIVCPEDCGEPYCGNGICELEELLFPDDLDSYAVNYCPEDCEL